MCKKSLLSLMLLCFAFFGVARAQVTIGDLETATNNSYLPMNSLYDYSYSQQIYTADEIGTAGTINSITLWMYGNANLYEMPFDIYMLEVDKDEFTSTTDWVPVTAADLVYSGSVLVHNTAAEEFLFELDAPFAYSGEGNLLIAFDNNTGSWKSGLNGMVFSAEDGVIRSIYARRDGSDYDPLNMTGITATSIVAARNVIEMDITPAGGVSCAKPRNLTINYEGGTTAEVSWTSEATAWNLKVNGEAVPGPITNPYTLTGLELATTYTVEVQADCGDDLLSNWATTSFTTDLCMPEDMCVLYFVVIDSYGDGWNNAYLQVADVATGEVLAQVANTSNAGAGEQQVYYMNVCDGREIQFTWHIGSYDSECTYGVFDLNEDLIFSGSGAMAEPFNWTVSCVETPCRKPSTPVASEVGPHSAKVSWTEYGPATEWVVAYKDSHAEDFTTVNTTMNPYTLTGLNPESTYTVKVLPLCEVDKWSDEMTFVTTEACPVPTAMEATHVTATTATLNWEGFGSQYNVRYAAEVHGTVLAQQNFEAGMGDWTTIDADGDGNNWDLMSAFGFSGTPHGGSDMVVSMSYYGGTVLTPDNYLVSPQINLDGAISFWACAQDASYPSEHFGVAVSTSGNTDAADFTTIWETTMTAKGGNDRGNAARFVVDGVRTNPVTTRSGDRTMGTWYHYTIDLSDYAGQTGYVALRHFDCSDWFYLDVDDIIIEVNDAPEIQWVELTVTDNNVDLTGLEAETGYMWQVQANCGDDGMGEWSTLSTFTTGSFCDTPFELEATDVTYNAATLNWYGSQDSYNVHYRTAEVTNEYYFTNFNAGATALQEEGWNWEGYIIYGLDDPIYGYDGDVNYFLQMGWATTEEAYIFSPQLPEYESGAVVEFYPFYYSVENTFQIGYSYTTNDTTAFSWSEPITAGTQNYDLKYSAVLPDGVKYIAFKATAESQSSCIFIDNFRIYSVVTPAGEWIEATVTEPTLALSGLTPETTYEWQVQGINPDCEELEWTAIATFTTPEQTTVDQVVSMSAGWTYWSANVEVTLDDLKAALVAALPGTTIVINSQSGQSTTYNGVKWRGSLTTLDLTQMYMIKVLADCEIVLTGMPIDPAALPITINTGTNWIAFPLGANMTVNDAFAGFAVPQDMVSSSAGSTTYNGTRWRGNISTLEPNQGYIYKSAAAEPRTLVYPTSAK